MKRILPFLLILLANKAISQKIDSIYVNLYTDSLKKGTYNYINVDGLLSNGHYLPLDSTHLVFSSSNGKFYGNTLWIDRNTTLEKVRISVVLRQNPAIRKEFEIWVKKAESKIPLKTVDQIMGKKKKGAG